MSDTSEKLAKYKPVDLGQEAKARQEILEQSLAAVVFIEKRVTFQDQKSGALLHGRKTIVGWVDVKYVWRLTHPPAGLPAGFTRTTAESRDAEWLLVSGVWYKKYKKWPGLLGSNK